MKILLFIFFLAVTVHSKNSKGSPRGASKSVSAARTASSNVRPSPRVSPTISLPKQKVIVQPVIIKSKIVQPVPVILKQKVVQPTPVIVKQKVVVKPKSSSGQGAIAAATYIESRLASIERKLTTPWEWRWTTTPLPFAHRWMWTTLTISQQTEQQRQTATPVSEILPVEDLFLSNCPSRIDVFVQGKNISYLFQSHKVFTLDNPSDLNGTFAVNASHLISEVFPGISRVTAAVYNFNWKRILLFNGRKISMFKIYLDEWVEDFLGPKELDDSITFIPTGAIWHNNQIVLLSDEGEFAVLDGVYNRAITSGNNYLQGFPSEVKGFSQSKGLIFTPKEIFKFNQTSHELTPISFEEVIECDLTN